MQKALKVENVNLTYAGSQVQALENVSFSLPLGCRAALVGPNGAGKSSLMKAILGLEKGVVGKIELLGQSENIAQLIEKKVAYIPQSSQVNWAFPARVFEIVLMGRFSHSKGILKRPSKLDKELAEAALERMNLQDLLNRQIDELSGGQQQRVFIARALCQEAECYLMDEPLAGIDSLTETIIMDTLKEFQEEGKTSLVIHHDLSTLNQYFDYLIWLNRTIIAAGPLHEVLTDQAYQATYGLGNPFEPQRKGSDSHV